MALLVASLGLIAAAIWVLSAGVFPPWQQRSQAADGVVAFALPQGVTLGPPPKLGAPAPAFTLPRTDGTPLALSALRGKAVVLNFWATWCAPCKQEFPLLTQLSQQHSGNLVVLGVDLGEDPAQIDRFAQQFGATFPIVIDENSTVVAQYRLVGIPSTFIIDSSGVLRAEHLGPVNQASLHKLLASTGL